MSVFPKSTGFPTALLEESDGVIGLYEGVLRASGGTDTRWFVSGGRCDQGIGVPNSGIEEALGKALHELSYGGNSKVEVEGVVTDIVRGSRDFPEKPVLEDLHFIEDARVRVSENDTRVYHDGTDNRGV